MQTATSAFDHLESVISGLGTGAFSDNLYRLIDHLAPIDHYSIFAFPETGAPRSVAVAATQQQTESTARDLADEYVDGAFSHDPTIKDVRSRFNVYSRSALVRKVVPSGMNDSSYRRRFYEEPAISEELSIISQQEGVTYYACLFRKASQPSFAPNEIDAIQFYSGLIIKAVHRQAELFGSRDPNLKPDQTALAVAKRDRLLAQVRTNLLAEAGLSPREADVCAHIALGFTIVAIGLKLNISINTVATHRKRAYAKLGICSQNELFARYISSSQS